jgi:transcriptional regulator with XRE-family HTH domain
MTIMDFGEKIKLLRGKQGITQAVLAKRAGLTLAYIGRLETGHYDPQLSTLKRLAKALRVSIAELVS